MIRFLYVSHNKNISLSMTIFLLTTEDIVIARLDCTFFSRMNDTGEKNLCIIIEWISQIIKSIETASFALFDVPGATDA